MYINCVTLPSTLFLSRPCLPMESPPAQPNSPCHVVAVPYPGRGHVNPMMNLCKLLLSKHPDIVITFVVTEEWFGFIRSDSNTTETPRNLRFATLPNVIPSEIDRAKDFPGFVNAVLRELSGPFEQLLDRLETPPTAIVSDTFLNWAVEAGKRRKIPVASFWTQSALTFSVLYYFDLLERHGHFPADLSERGDELVDYIPGVSPIRLSDLPTIFYGNGRTVLTVALSVFSTFLESQYLLFSSFYELEPSIIESLQSTISFPIYTVGPTIPYTAPATTDHYFRWLDTQPSNSVLYVSLGSYLSVSDAQLNEIIAGILDSGVRFLWVARGDADRIRDACGSVDTCMVVSWCNQLKVLSHGSVGGFWTHCGWNSTLEGISAGLPMLTCPIFWDQIPNSKEVSEDWGIGVRVGRGSEGLVISREEIAKLVRRLMDESSEEGREMRRKSTEMKEGCRRAVAKGGSSDRNLDAFIRNIYVTTKE